MSENIETKIRNGNFWGKDGAIADTRRLALLALNQPGSSLIDAISLMTNVHTKASKYALSQSGESTKLMAMRRYYKKLYCGSNRALWFYHLLWRVLSFFSWL